MTYLTKEQRDEFRSDVINHRLNLPTAIALLDQIDALKAENEQLKAHAYMDHSQTCPICDERGQG